MSENLDRWKNDPEYRAKIVRELEQAGSIQKMNGTQFNHIVNGEF